MYCLRFLLMILLLVEMMNQSLGTCPKFGVHFKPRVQSGQLARLRLKEHIQRMPLEKAESLLSFLTD
ncbi:hypothetical protein ABIE59_001696 [Marinobacter sp. MBR-99]